MDMVSILIIGKELIIMAKKKKNRYGNPEKNIAAQQAKEAAAQAKENANDGYEKSSKAFAPAPASEKPMFMRILVLAIAAVMVLGIVVGAVIL